MDVLLVEDHEPSLKVEAALLRELGFDCAVARDGAEALDMFLMNQYAVVMMDIQIPGFDGLETARRIRRIEADKSLPPSTIIGMTGHATDDDRLLCLKAGMNDYISKPFRLAELEEKLLIRRPDFPSAYGQEE